MAHKGHHDWPPSSAGPSTTWEPGNCQPFEKGAQVQVKAPGHEDSNENGRNTPPTHNLLALDGGGVRGYWTLKVLQRLMDQIGRIEEGHTVPNLTSFHPHRLDRNCSHVQTRGANNDDTNISSSDDVVGEAAELRNIPRGERYLPCHYFDYIGGSSTGALIAIMLGCLRMPVPDCLDEYARLGTKVFGHPNHIFEMRFPFPFISRPKYSEKGLSEAVNDVHERRKPKHIGHQESLRFPYDDDLCKTFVTTLKTRGYGQRIALLRSYDHEKRSSSQHPTPSQSRVTTDFSAPESRNTGISQNSIPNFIPSAPYDPPRRTGTHVTTASMTRKSKTTDRSARRHTNYGPATNWELYKIARAATAAELYFPPLEHEEDGINNEREHVKYMDGGFSNANNPTMQGIEDIRQRWGKSSVGTVVSVGTARRDPPAQNKRWSFPGRVKRWTDRMTDPQPIHDDVESQSNEFGFPYFRFNARGNSALQISLDEWKPRRRFRIQRSRLSGHKTRSEMDRKFNDWLVSDPSVNDQLNECAEMLVEARRNRMTSEAEWERFALCARYYCRETGCKHQHSCFLDRDEFNNHLSEHYGHQDAQQAESDENNGSSNETNENKKIQRALRRGRKIWEYRPRQK